MRVSMILLAAALGVSILSGGCATIIDGGGRQNLSIRSTPPEATVSIYDLRNNNSMVSKNQTPAIVNLRTGDGYFVPAKYKLVVEKAGYAKQEITVDCTVRGWYIGGNIVLGGLVGWLIVDPISGAMYKFNPEVYEPSLVTARADNHSPGEATLHVALKQELSEEMQAKLVRLN